jgi:predicted dienelactone hydrolase
MRPQTRTAFCLVALLLGAAAATRADDACLAGDSTLGDQRGIAAFRTTLDTTCPCDSFVSRGSYRLCGKNVISQAVTGATLRTQCERTAKKLLKGSTCGSDRVTCGRIRETAAEPVSCKVRRETACLDTSGTSSQGPCDAQDFCADVVDWTAGTCSDVRVRGPFEAGVTHIVFTKQSAVDPLQPRPLDTYIWYPTTAGAGPFTGSQGGVVDAPLDASGGPYPIVLFSHGSCGYARQSTFFTSVLASRGYIVIAPPHPGNTLDDGLAVCGSIQAQVDSLTERPEDMIFVLDQMLAENANALSLFHGALDPSRVAMTGHSFGGLTTFLVQAREPRITVALPMAPAAGPTQAGFTVPSMMMLGASDSVVNIPNAEAAYGRSVGPKALVKIDHTGHYAFSNGCFASPDCNPPVTLTQAEAHLLVNRWVLPFLEVYLVGDDSYAPLLSAPAPPSVVLDSEL